MYFESTFIRPGYSGGGLFDEDWLLVGMIVGDDAPDGQAVGLDTIAERLRNWRYPVQWGSPADPPDFVSLGRLEDRHFGVTADGRVYAWGKIWKDAAEPMRLVEGLHVRNMNGPCGQTTTGRAFCWSQIDEGDQIKYLIVGETADPQPASAVFDQITGGCGIGHDRKTYCWGYWRGNGTEQFDSSSLTEIYGNLEMKAISGDLEGHVCALTTAGAAYCWGLGGSGQLGNGARANQSIPVPVSGNLTFESIFSGFGVSCGITAAGKTYCWGANDYRQLGKSGARSTVPVEVTLPAPMQSLAITDNSLCGLAKDQSIWCWGRTYQPEPVKLPVTAYFVSLQPPSYQASAEPHHFDDTCALTVQGSAYCWNPASTPEPSPEGSYWGKLNRISLYTHDRDYVKAEQAARDALNRFPDVPAVLATYGQLMADLNRTQEVRQSIETLRQIAAAPKPAGGEPSSRPRLALLYIAELQNRLKNLDGALAALDAAEKLSAEGQIQSIRMARARIYTKLGQSVSGIDEYRKVLRADKDEFATMNDLAYELAAQPNGLEEALDLAERSLDDAPEDTDRLDTNAYILTRMGKLDNAQKLLERARANGASHDVYVLEHSGDLCLRQGKNAEAQRNWKEALDEWNKLPAGARDANAIARLTGKLAKR